MKKLFKKDHFNFTVSEGAARGFLMEIVSGHLSYHDKSGTHYIPRKKSLETDWGRWRSNDIVSNNYHPLPNRMYITFFSYTENQFYEGAFDLDYEQLLALFKKGYLSPLGGGYQQKTYDLFVVGLAPGGVVQLWVNGINRQKAVFIGQAKKIEGNWKWILDNPNYTREEIVRDGITEAYRNDEDRKTYEYYQQHGLPFGRWNDYYNKRYHWEPILTGMTIRDNLIEDIQFYNGELDFLTVPLHEDHKGKTIAVPKALNIFWKRTGYLVDDLFIEIHFNEQEIYSAFDTLGGAGQALKMEFRMERENNDDFTIWLHNDKNSIELKPQKLETWKPGGRRYREAKPTDTE